MFVHGEERKMEFLKSRVEKEFEIPVFKPANGETITINTNAAVYINVREEIIAKSIANCPSPSKRHCPFNAYVLMNKETKELDVVTPKEAAKILGVDLFTIAFSELYEVEEVNWERIAKKFKNYDPELQVKRDGIEMFDGELSFMNVSRHANQFEVIWEETREHWLEILLGEISARKVDPALVKTLSKTPMEYR
uniref:Uncharacterized protein n=1 Tax=Ditylenchus dipsaci TaxID=166011 RepID=A0A915DI60_9BILA